MHYIISNGVLYAFNTQNGGKGQLTTIQSVKCIQNEVQDDVMHYAK